MKRILFVAMLALAVAAFARPRVSATAPHSNVQAGYATNQDGSRVMSTDELDVDTLVTYTFETDSTSWTVDNLTARAGYWHRDYRRAYGGSGLCWACNDTVQFPNGGYDNHTLNYLISPALNLSTTTNPVLGFKVNHWVEGLTGGYPTGYTGWDGCNVWYSTNNGTSWAVLPITAANGYAYNVTSSYAFGFEFGMGTGIAAWGGGSNGWRTVSVPLTAAMRVAQFKLRFALCSDPGFCTTDSTALFGMCVDSIRINDGAATILYNDADANSVPSDMTSLNGVTASPTNWTRIQDNTGAGLHTRPYCMHINEDANVFMSALVSPRIFLQRGYRYTYMFNIKCDMRDVPTSGNLTDLFDVWIKDANHDSLWHRLMYDYYRAGVGGGTGAAIWFNYQHGVGFVATPPSFQSDTSLDVTPWSGDSVQFRIVAYGDSLNANGSGTGCYIDDFTVLRSSQADHDAGTSMLAVPYPNAVGFLTRGSVNVKNYGRLDESNIIMHWTKNGAIAPPDTVALTSGSAAVRLLKEGSLGAAARGWTPTAGGKVMVTAYTTLTGDTATLNDLVSLSDSVYVHPAGEYELGYDSRRNPFYFRFQNGFNPMIKCTPHADSVPGTAWNVTGVRMMFNGDVGTNTRNMRVKIYADNNGVPGALLSTSPITVNNTNVVPNWFTSTITTTTVTGNFWLYVDGATAADTAHVLGDNYSILFPTPMGHNFTYNGSILGADLNQYDFVMHPIIVQNTEVKEVVSSTLPGKFELYDAYPNPFNPTTDIKFSVPNRSQVKVSVFNMNGQEVAQLVSRELNAGTYRATVNGARMASGIYFVRMNAGSFNASRKIVLVK